MPTKDHLLGTAPRAFAHPSANGYIQTMTIDDLEKAVAKLPPDNLERFRVWFEAFDGARFDEKIERDAKSGKLDRLADQAIADLRKGRAREL